MGSYDGGHSFAWSLSLSLPLKVNLTLHTFNGLQPLKSSLLAKLDSETSLSITWVTMKRKTLAGLPMTLPD